jgi:hypothetical protein
MARITHNIVPRKGQGELNARLAAVSAILAGAVITITGSTGAPTATVANPDTGNPGTGVAVTGTGPWNITFSGNPAFDDVVTITINGEIVKIGGAGQNAQTAASFAGQAFGAVQALISGDLVEFLAADKHTAVSTTIASGAGMNCLTAGLRYTLNTDVRPTTSSAGGTFPTSQAQTVINDSETTS